MRSRPKRFHDNGLSLTELLVALGLGSFLLLGIVNVFLSTTDAAQAETALARVQENGRFALDMLSDDLRRARYSGCNSVDGVVTVMASGIDYKGISGFERRGTGANWTPDPDAPSLSPIKTEARNGSDVLNVQMSSRLGQDLLNTNINSSSSSFQLKTNPDCAVQNNGILILSSCLSAHLMRVTNTPNCANPADPVTVEFATSGNSITSITPGYRDSELTEVMSFSDAFWYVADTGRQKHSHPVYALYRRVNGGSSQEMIEGVEHMQLLFGIPSGKNTRYAPARDIHPDWDQVTSVRVALLIQSFASVRDTDDTAVYALLDEAIGPDAHSGGKVLRQVFRTTVVLRNAAFDTPG